MKKNKDIKLCPFRKMNSMAYMTANEVTLWEEEFLPCIKDACMAYETEHPFFDNYVKEYCKLMRK